MKIITSLVLLAAFITGCSRTSNVTGSATSAPTLDTIAVWLKIEYYPKTPKTPAYVPGQPSVIPISRLTSVFSATRPDIVLTNSNYDYCNLSPAQWTALRAQTPTLYPVAWSPAPDAGGRREVATVDLSTDVFGTWTITEQQLTNALARMERVIRKATGQEDFSLRFSQSP
jgi:hypothetical protein